MQKFFKHHALVEFFEYALFFLKRKGVNEFFFHLRRQPVNFHLIADIFEFNAHMMGITFLEMFQDIAQAGSSQADQVTGKKGLVKVIFGESKETQSQVSSPILSRTD